MLKQFKLKVITFFAFMCAVVFAQENPAPDSSIIPEPVASALTEDNDDSTSERPARLEIDLSIEQIQSPEIIGGFYNELKYDLSFEPDTIIEKIKEYVADMRARHAVRSVIYNIGKPIGPSEMPFMIQFNSNIFTGFKPVLPLLRFGF